MMVLTKEEEKKFKKDRCRFLNYRDISEYVEDIVVCLVYSSWHYSEEEARQQCEDRMNFIEQYFEEKTPVDDAAADAGYSCG